MRKGYLTACAMVFTLACPAWVRGSITMSVPGATTQENQEFNEAFRTPEGLDALLRKNPDNRAALLIRVGRRVRAGDIPGANADLEHIHALTPDFPGLQSWYAEVSRAAGDVPHEIAALEMLVKASEPSGKLLADYRTARILELRGDLEGCRKVWQTTVDNAVPRMKTLFEIDAAKFELCHGNSQEAIAQLQKVLRQEGNSPENVVDAQSILSFAYWAAGQKVEALQSLQATRAAINKVPNFNTELESFCALAAYTLAHGPSDAHDQAWTTDWLNVAARRYPDLPDSPAPVMALLQGKPQPDLVAHVRTVLKAAPQMEWAQWSAVILRLHHVPDADTLPIEQNSIPGRVLAPAVPAK